MNKGRAHSAILALLEGVEFERNHLRGKAAHRRRRRKNLEEKSRWLEAYSLGDALPTR